MVDCPWDAYTAHSWRGKLFAPLAWWRMRRTLARTPFAIYVTERFLQRRYPTRGHAAVASNVTLSGRAAGEPAPRSGTVADRAVSVGGEGDASSLRPGAAVGGGSSIGSWPAEGELRVGLIGNCDVPLKGHRVLLEAVAGLASRFPGARLVFIGGGERGELERAARRHGLLGRLEFAGRVPAGEPLLACLDGLDVYVHPSFKEGLPRAVIEAMSRGRAVLASRAGGTGELLGEERLHAPGDAATLAEQLAELLGDAPLRERLGRENRAVAERYSPAALAERRRAFWGEFAAYCRTRIRTGG